MDKSMSIINLGKWERNNVGYFRHIIESTSVGVDVICNDNRDGDFF